MMASQEGREVLPPLAGVRPPVAVRMQGHAFLQRDRPTPDGHAQNGPLNWTMAGQHGAQALAPLGRFTRRADLGSAHEVQEGGANTPEVARIRDRENIVPEEKKQNLAMPGQDPPTVRHARLSIATTTPIGFSAPKPVQNRRAPNSRFWVALSAECASRQQMVPVACAGFWGSRHRPRRDGCLLGGLETYFGESPWPWGARLC